MKPLDRYSNKRCYVNSDKLAAIESELTTKSFVEIKTAEDPELHRARLWKQANVRGLNW